MVKMVTLGVHESNYSDVMSGVTRHYKGGYHNLLSIRRARVIKPDSGFTNPPLATDLLSTFST